MWKKASLDNINLLHIPELYLKHMINLTSIQNRIIKMKLIFILKINLDIIFF